MLGRLITLLLMGYVGIILCVQLVPLITGIDISSLEAESEIVFIMTGVAQWLLPLAGVVLLIVGGVSMINSNRKGRM